MDGGGRPIGITDENKALLTLCRCECCGLVQAQAVLEISRLRRAMRRIAAKAKAARTVRPQTYPPIWG